MTSLEHHALPVFLTEENFTFSQADNTNWKIKHDWMTPAELTQWIERQKQSIQRDIAADFANPDHRLSWKIVLAMERCALWQVFGVRTCDDSR